MSSKVYPNDKYKLFIGGLSWKAEGEDLRQFFETKYGPLLDYAVVYDHVSHRSRGFGFVAFKSSESLTKCLNEFNNNPEMFVLFDRKMDVKPVVPREQLPPPIWPNGAKRPTYRQEGQKDDERDDRRGRRERSRSRESREQQYDVYRTIEFAAMRNEAPQPYVPYLQSLANSQYALDRVHSQLNSNMNSQNVQLQSYQPAMSFYQIPSNNANNNSTIAQQSQPNIFQFPYFQPQMNSTIQQCYQPFSGGFVAANAYQLQQSNLSSIPQSQNAVNKTTHQLELNSNQTNSYFQPEIASNHLATSSISNNSNSTPEQNAASTLEQTLKMLKKYTGSK